MTRDPAAELDAVCQLLDLADDLAERTTGQPLGVEGHCADLAGMAAWMRRHPYLSADIADAMPQETP